MVPNPAIRDRHIERHGDSICNVTFFLLYDGEIYVSMIDVADATFFLLSIAIMWTSWNICAVAMWRSSAVWPLVVGIIVTWYEPSLALHILGWAYKEKPANEIGCISYAFIEKFLCFKQDVTCSYMNLLLPQM
jgi:hypothetical protein